MPLPIRDLSGVHTSINPTLATLHRAYPLSKYVPLIGVLKLYQLNADGLPLVSLMNTASWMNLACLDDVGADQCITHMVWMIGAGCPDRDVLNAAFAHVAAPYLVPMLVPNFLPGMRPTYSSTSTPLITAVPPPPPPKHSPASVGKLHGSVLRCICAVAKQHRVDMSVFDHNFGAMAKMTAGDACKALRDFGRLLRPADSKEADSKEEADSSDTKKARADLLARLLATYTQNAASESNRL